MLQHDPQPRLKSQAGLVHACSIRTTSLALVSEYQVTFWRDLPSLVVAREGDSVTKGPLAQRFQEAIDEAAMRLGAVGSDDYLDGWTRSEWTSADGAPADVCERVVAELEADWSDARLAAYLDELGPSST
jgi:hypothetical protein